MATPSKLPSYQRLITTHNSDGKAILSDTIDSNEPWQDHIVNNIAAFSLGYTSSGFPAELNGDKDIGRYSNLLANPPGLVKNDGTVLRIVDMAPGSTSPMHRTVSLDYVFVMLGEVELVLDSGETKIMKQGDICVQKGTMHAWRNVSQNEWSRMLYVLQPSRPIKVGGKTLYEDYGGMDNVPNSS